MAVVVAVTAGVVMGPLGAAVALPGSTPGEVAPRLVLRASADVGSVGEVTATPTEGLSEGDRITVTGTGFDTSAGIYVAICVDNGPGLKPTPCVGGADTEGVGGAIWISDNPPSYAEGLTLPYGPDGGFEVELPVVVVDEITGVDCRVEPCAVTTRFDHLRGEDRQADHVIALSIGDEADQGSAADDASADDGEGADGAEGAATEQPVPEETAEPDDASADDGAVDGADTDAADRSVSWLPIALVVLGIAAVATTVVVVRRARAAPAAPPERDSDHGP